MPIVLPEELNSSTILPNLKNLCLPFVVGMYKIFYNSVLRTTFVHSCVTNCEAILQPVVGRTIDHRAFIQKLLAVTKFPYQKNQHELKTMLEKPLEVKIPVYQEGPEPFSDLFEACQNPPDIGVRLQLWTRKTLPNPGSAEIVWSGWWDDIVIEIAQQMMTHCNVNLRVNRDVADSSISIKLARRDYNLWLNGVLVAFGEDKSTPDLMNDAIKELSTKTAAHGLTSALFGPLQYALCFTTAGPEIEFHFLPNQKNSNAVSISPRYNVTVDENRKQVLITFINFFRWVRSVFLSGCISNTFAAGPIEHDNPFISGQRSTVALGDGCVAKSFTIPKDRVSNFIAVYKAVENCRNSLGEIELRIFETKGKRQKMKRIKFHDLEDKKQSQIPIEIATTRVGTTVVPLTSDVGALAIKAVLTFLVDFHAHGFVHRDLRWPNILQTDDDWMVIDYELAGPIGSPIFWEPHDQTIFKDDQLLKGERGFEILDDLFQVSILIQNLPFQNQRFASFSQKLNDGDFQTAQIALSNFVTE
eukprot:TRINITY_DN2885_c0_g1_i1.p1 TRINITY_DN2885_c0_g1~~TRINITY_DN2885_c0_g1_i1.p1  ORF type:complete len:529 (-),score=63.67 TRINITY_DN2885_c0_g1_i1:210-1796(-)